MSEKKNILRVENVTMQFGGVVAVDNLNMEINEGEIVALIGPNGAGKTTAFNVITGVYALYFLITYRISCDRVICSGTDGGREEERSL